MIVKIHLTGFSLVIINTLSGINKTTLLIFLTCVNIKFFFWSLKTEKNTLRSPRVRLISRVHGLKSVIYIDFLRIFLLHIHTTR